MAGFMNLVRTVINRKLVNKFGAVIIIFATKPADRPAVSASWKLTSDVATEPINAEYARMDKP